MSLGSGNGLVPNRRKGIIWTNADPVRWHIFAALGGDGVNQDYMSIKGRNMHKWGSITVVAILAKMSWLSDALVAMAGISRWPCGRPGGVQVTGGWHWLGTRPPGYWMQKLIGYCLWCREFSSFLSKKYHQGKIAWVSRYLISLGNWLFVQQLFCQL